MKPHFSIIHPFTFSPTWRLRKPAEKKKKDLKNFSDWSLYKCMISNIHWAFYVALNSLFLERSLSHFPPLSSTQYLTLTQVPHPVFLGRWPCLLLPSEKKLTSPLSFFLAYFPFHRMKCFLPKTNPSQWLLVSPKICHYLLFQLFINISSSWVKCLSPFLLNCY